MHEYIRTYTKEEASAESKRCLSCDKFCAICATVCPNRANIVYKAGPAKIKVPVLANRKGTIDVIDSIELKIDQEYQILNIGDSCNECGNCTTFCPTGGSPYKNKPKLYLTEKSFMDNKDDSFYINNNKLSARINNEYHYLELKDDKYTYYKPHFVSEFKDGEFFGFKAFSPDIQPDLDQCAIMLAIFKGIKDLKYI
jgi:putative selenate reductase